MLTSQNQKYLCQYLGISSLIYGSLLAVSLYIGISNNYLEQHFQLDADLSKKPPAFRIIMLHVYYELYHIGRMWVRPNEALCNKISCGFYAPSPAVMDTTG